MWKYNETSNLPGNSLYHSTYELYHHGVLGMKWGHRKRKISNFLKKSVNISSEYIKRDIDNFFKTNKRTNKQFLNDTSKKYGKKSTKLISAGYHGLAAAGSIICANSLRKMGTKTIKSYTDVYNYDNEKWRVGAAYALVSIPVLYFGYDAAKNIVRGIKEQQYLSKKDKVK